LRFLLNLLLMLVVALAIGFGLSWYALSDGRLFGAALREPVHGHAPRCGQRRLLRRDELRGPVVDVVDDGFAAVRHGRSGGANAWSIATVRLANRQPAAPRTSVHRYSPGDSSSVRPCNVRKSSR